jgi:O-acetyl-ADP-ribose deacetylase (regulator of RNase III)
MHSSRLVVLLDEDLVVLPADAQAQLAAGEAWHGLGLAVDGRVNVACVPGRDRRYPVVRVAVDPAATWLFAESASVWRPLSADAALKLEAARDLAHSSVLGPKWRVVMNATVYEADMAAMTQTNLTSGGSRSLKRNGPATIDVAPLSDDDAMDERQLQRLRSEKPGEGPFSPVNGTTYAAPSIGPASASPLPPEPPTRGPSYAAPTTYGSPLRPVPPAAPATGRIRLLFPSISTSIFMFDLDKAATIAADEIARFLFRFAHCPHLELSLIDYGGPGETTTPTVNAFMNAWRRMGGSDRRFTQVVGDIGNSAVRGQCFAIVNAANGTFSGGASTSGFNRAVHLAAGPGLEADTRKVHGGKASVGVAYDVALRPDSPLRAESGTRYVIHVVGPNMNPSRPHYLNENYEEGGRVLRSTYRAFLRRFAELAKLPSS